MTFPLSSAALHSKATQTHIPCLAFFHFDSYCFYHCSIHQSWIVVIVVISLLRSYRAVLWFALASSKTCNHMWWHFSHPFTTKSHSNHRQRRHKKKKSENICRSECGVAKAAATEMAMKMLFGSILFWFTFARFFSIDPSFSLSFLTHTRIRTMPHENVSLEA